MYEKGLFQIVSGQVIPQRGGERRIEEQLAQRFRRGSGEPLGFEPLVGRGCFDDKLTAEQRERDDDGEENDKEHEQ